MSAHFVHVALAVFALVGVIAAAEWLRRRLGAEAEFARKIAHIGGGHIILIAWWLQIPTWLGVVTTAVVFVGVAAALARYGILISRDGSKRTHFGFFYYALSHVVLIAFFWPQGGELFAALGVLVMAWGDGLAGFVGHYLGRHRYSIRGANKSWEGSATMFGVSVVVILALLVPFYGWGTAWLPALGVAAAATAVEAVSRKGEDNLTIPLLSAFLAYVWLGGYH